jgi:hypothetical protein
VLCPPSLLLPPSPLLLRRLLPSQQRAGRSLRTRVAIQPTVLPCTRVRCPRPPGDVRTIPPIRTPSLRPPVRVIKMRTMLDIVPWAHSPLRTNMHKSQHVIASIRVTNPRDVHRPRRARTQRNQARRPLRTRMTQRPQMPRLIQLITKTTLRATVELLLRIQPQPHPHPSQAKRAQSGGRGGRVGRKVGVASSPTTT